MDRAQRIVLVVASGVAVAAIAEAVDRVNHNSLARGWFAYSPNIGVAGEPFGSSGDIQSSAAVWLVAAALWAGLALWLLRTPRPATERRDEG